jgi:uncharacterized repeat protein (TIGR01451 family)
LAPNTVYINLNSANGATAGHELAHSEGANEFEARLAGARAANQLGDFESARREIMFLRLHPVNPFESPFGGFQVGNGDSDNTTSRDPNALIGPTGFGTQNFVQSSATLPYTVDFENDGSVAAQDVTVTEYLNSNLDCSTFQLGSFGFGPVKVTVPAGLTQYRTTVAYQSTDGSPLNVQVSLDFNVQSGELTATFTSLDPLTGQAPDGVFDGFLPPNNSSHVGEGFVQYTVSANPQAGSGTTINQQASVVFDINAALATNIFSNTILNTVSQTTLSEPAGPSAPVAEPISKLLGGHFSDTSSKSKPGIAVFYTSGAGTWQYSTNGKTWTNIAAVAASNALLLPQADELRFVSAPLAAGADAAELIDVAWDGLTGAAGHYVHIGSTGGGSSFSANSGELDVTLTQVTAPPLWLTGTTTLTPVPPSGSNAGETVAAAFGSDFSGDNNQSAAIAVVGATNNRNGVWQYALSSNATNFIDIPKSAAGAGFVLESADLIRFEPTKSSFAGHVSLSVDAWDGGAASDANSVKLNKTDFSSTTLTAKLYFNHAPTQNAVSVSFLPNIPDNAPSKEVSVATLLKDAGAADQDKNSLGLALTEAISGGVGTWQYELSGGVWQNVPASLSEASALLLPASAMLRYDPTVNYAGTATLMWQAWDGTDGTNGTPGFAITETGGATAFSSNSATGTLTVNPSQRQDPPAWSGRGATLMPVVAGTTTQQGNTVASVFGSYFKDPNATVGIAVSGVTGTTDGQWYYSTAGGTSWTKLPKVSASSALLLSANDELAFVPNAGFLGTVKLTAYAWEGMGAGNTHGKQVSAKGAEFSSTTLTATCLVNTAPVLTP